ncbi:hypothetical protein FKM82_027373 [Ascaphus truei]
MGTPWSSIRDKSPLWLIFHLFSIALYTYPGHQHIYDNLNVLSIECWILVAGIVTFVTLLFEDVHRHLSCTCPDQLHVEHQVNL